jgi:hypothetical protein
MKESYKWSRLERSLRNSRTVKVLAGAALALAMLPAGALASRVDKPMRVKSPAARMAERLESKIINHPQARVSYDATHDLYWDQTDNGIFRYRTEVPLTARVGARHVLRYFGVRNKGDNRQGLDVFPVPAGALKAESQYDGFFHDGTDPSSHGSIQLDPDTHQPTTVLTYANGDPSVRVNVGDTSFYGREGVLIPPPPAPAPPAN